MKDLVSKETVLLNRWGSETEISIKHVDKGQTINTVTLINSFDKKFLRFLYNYYCTNITPSTLCIFFSLHF